MQVKIERGYTGAGHYNLDEMTDKALGMLVRGLLRSIQIEGDQFTSEPELRIKEVKETEKDV